MGGLCQPKEPKKPIPQHEDPYPCANRLSPSERWACEEDGLQFPTVECLVQDVITCGNVKDKSCVFYSMGAEGIDARTFAAQDLNGQGVTFHMALDGSYMKRVMDNPVFDIASSARNAGNLSRKDIYIRKLSQALASVCKNDAYLMVLKRNGDGGGVGIHQTPWVHPKMPSRYMKDNVWEDHELPSLQLNDRVPRIYSVDMSNNNERHEDWVRGRDPQTRQLTDPEAIPLPVREIPIPIPIPSSA